MYLIDQPDPPEGFLDAWFTGAEHLQRKGDGHLMWIRANPYKPFIEHLSFRMGNQLFWVFIEMHEGSQVLLPYAGQARDFFLEMTRKSGLIPCILRMQRHVGGFAPMDEGWGLLHGETMHPLDPVSMVTGDRIEMSDWEVHDMAIQIVINHLEQEGKEITSHASYLGLDPSIWFSDEQGAQWVVLRASRYSNEEPARPAVLEQLARSPELGRYIGHFAPVSMRNDDDPELPLFRGHAADVTFHGLEPALSAHA